MANAFDAILFDLDGTLLDTLKDIAISANHALASKGFEPREEALYRYYVGEGVVKLFENVFATSPQPPEVIASLVQAFEAHYATQFHCHTTPYAGIGKLLTFCQTRGLKMAILSNKPDSFTKMCAFRYLRNWTFGAVYGAREGIPRKPDPKGALDVAEVLHVDPRACLYLGDTMIDMITAHQAHMVPIGALWGFRDATELQEHGARFVAQSPSETIKVIASLL